MFCERDSHVTEVKPLTMCAYAQDQMPETTVITHLVALAIGFVGSSWIGTPNKASDCPACILSCGNVSCPAHSCSTGHIEIGSFSLLVISCLVIGGLTISWWVRRGSISLATRDPAPARAALVDGRRALGQSIGWRPESRG